MYFKYGMIHEGHVVLLGWRWLPEAISNRASGVRDSTPCGAEAVLEITYFISAEM